MAMMDQQNFEAPRPVSADPAVALARALGQLPKAPVKARGAAKPNITGIVAKTSVEDLAGEHGLTLGDQNELTIRRIKRGKSYSFIRANGTPIRHVGTIRRREAAQTKVGEVSALSRGSAATHTQNDDEDGWWPPNPPVGRGE